MKNILITANLQFLFKFVCEFVAGTIFSIFKIGFERAKFIDQAENVDAD